VRRINVIISRLRSEPVATDIVIVTHGHFIREFMNYFINAGKFLRFPVKNCSETKIEIGEVDTIHYVNRELV
jgi:broad specificity phosphatase PhoE